MKLLSFLRDWFVAPAIAEQPGLPPSPPSPLLFLHIPKTAGSSVNEFLVNRFAANELCSIYPAFGDDVPKLVPARPVGCYAGHVHYAITDHLPPNLKVFTILRDPIERALSAYFFYKRIPKEELLRGGPYIAAIQQMNLAEFARRHPKSARSTFGNYQTFYFSRDYSTYPEPDERPIVRADLDRAKDNLAKCIVGLTDRLHDALALLCHEYGWPCPDRVAEANRTPDRPRALDRDSQAWLEENTALDAELFRFGRELFEQHWEKYQRSQAVPSTRLGTREYRLSFDQPIPGYGWHPRETFPGGHFCFTEPDAWLECPAPKGRRLRVEIATLPLLPPEHESPFTLRVNGAEVRLTRRATPEGDLHEGFVTPREAANLRLDFHADRPVRPRDVFPGSTDGRLLSLAVREVRLRAA